MNVTALTNKLTAEATPKPKGRGYDFYIVKNGERIVGFLEKIPNTRTETHPWKAYRAALRDGRPMADGDMKFFYADDGGKKAALTYIAGGPLNA